MQNKVIHAAERKAFKTVLDRFIAKSQTESAAEAANDLIGVVEKIMKGAWSDGSFDMLRQIAADQNSKWARYADRIIKDSDPKILSSFLLNAAYEGGFRGYRTA